MKKLCIIGVCLLLLLCSCASEPKAAGSCGEWTFDADYYAFVRNAAGSDEAAEEEIKKDFALLALCREYLPDVSVDDKDVFEAAQALLDARYPTEEALKETLDSMGMTKDVFLFQLRLAVLSERLREKMFVSDFYADVQTLLGHLKNDGCLFHTVYTYESAEAATRAEAPYSDAKATSEGVYFFDLGDARDGEMRKLMNGERDSLTVGEKVYVKRAPEDKEWQDLEIYQLPTVLAKYQDRAMDDAVNAAAEKLTVTLKYSTDVT